MSVLAHREFGSGNKPPLIILHGLLGSSRNWQSVGNDLANDFHVFALDARNHGDSFHADEMSYGAMATDVANWMDANGLETTYLLGHSMGGKVAMRLACEKPERLEKVVAVDIAPRAYPSTHIKEFEAMNAVDTTNLASRMEAENTMEAFVPDWAMRRFLLTNLDRSPDGGFRWIINLPGIENALPTLEAYFLDANDVYEGDILFLLGGKSRYFADGDEEPVADHFPRARITMIAQSGHNPHFDARDDFVAAVRTFLLGEG